MVGHFSTVPGRTWLYPALPGFTWLYLALLRSAKFYLTINCHRLPLISLMLLYIQALLLKSYKWIGLGMGLWVWDGNL